MPAALGWSPDDPTTVLRQLHIRNLAVIVEASIELGDGLNIITGETGAGKSILVDALGLLAGARASSDLIRSGSDRLNVSALFEPLPPALRGVLSEFGIDPESDQLVVRREVSREGRNRIYIDDQPATLRALRAIAPRLLHIHTQREELELLSSDLQRRWLDRYGGEAARLESTATAWSDLRRVAARLEKATGDERLRLERVDLLQFQLDEIDAAKLEPGEEHGLRETRLRLRNRAALVAALSSAAELLREQDDSAAERIARAEAALTEIGEWQPQADAWGKELTGARIRLEEVADELRRQLDGLDAEDGDLDGVEGRLAELERLFRKYGDGSAAVLERRAAAESELADLVGDEEHRAQLQERHEHALATYRDSARALSTARRRWGRELAATVGAELADLSLAGAEFTVDLDMTPHSEGALEVGGRSVACGADGYDRVSFQFAPNPGEGTRPLARIASGGELSRVFLALQLALRERRSRGGRSPKSSSREGLTLVFDEVDAGVGGAEAAVVGRKLQSLAGTEQVIAITHSPQVACQGSDHFRVAKRAVGGRTEASLVALDRTDRIEELARMLGGEEVTALSRSHAEELLQEAEKVPA